ncbi:hypothetical protein EXT46_14880 [Pseudoalteromonas sp. CO325X]|uniref:secretin N-terminal domain-containing protein n=1 Tax=Pseudoalteromonas sp. CO325X TaxID=1777262 RepID=UPI001023EA4C|nr:secretin N-terminal domain-containing protein [Pseudoalteromonas sp. CO325X]RZF79174.1 hypothetical protein EXT46_14880 [Pseudoalteromonas sp. CO325X]
MILQLGFRQMKRIMLRATILLLASSTLLGGCASTTKEERLSNGENIKINKSFLKGDYKAPNNQDPEGDDDSKKRRNALEVDQVPGMAGLVKMKQEAGISPSFDSSKVTFVADQMAIKLFADEVFGDLLGLNYVLDPALAASKTAITLNFSQPVDKAVLYRNAIDTLQQNSVNTYRKNNILYLQKQQGSDKKNDIPIGIGANISDIPDTAGTITQLVPYTYTESKNITSILGKLSSATVTVHGLQKLMVLEGSQEELKRALRIVNMLDVPRAYGRKVRMYKFANVKPSEAETKIKELLGEDGYQINSGGDIAFVSMPRINALVAYAASDDVINRISYWAQEIDVPIAGDEKQYYVFKPKFSKAEEMHQTLSRLFQASIRNSSDEETVSDAPKIENIRMSVDKQQNALIFQATPAEYRQLESLLSQVDVLPGQVILDVSILEVNLQDDVSSGIEWLFNSRGLEGSRGLTSTLSSAGGSIAAVALDGNWQAEINFKETQDDVRILSRPYLIVKDGQSATINSGDQVPIITQVVEGTSNINTGTVANSVQYRNTGVNVTIAPTINSDGVVSLDVNMSVSRSSESSNIQVSTPKITNRSIQTKVISRDGQTVALGGLIQDTVTEVENGVPVLSDIPLFGKLFSSSTDNNSRTELIMLITTRIVRDSTQVDEFGKKISELYNTPITLD